jgi:IS5 family transposase
MSNFNKKYKTSGKKGLFDQQETIEKHSKIGNPLEKISSVIDFEFFRTSLESMLLNTEKKNNAGAKPYDVVMMFKILILQRYFGLGDSQVEFQITDRLSFKKFVGLETGDKVPDEKTVWLFRENLTKSGLVLDDLLTEDDKGQNLHADSEYTGDDQEKVVIKYQMNNCVYEKGYRNKALTVEQKEKNREKSKTRARVEHVFGFMEQSMNGLAMRSVGIARAGGIIGLINLTYNLFRYEQVVRSDILDVN